MKIKQKKFIVNLNYYNMHPVSLLSKPLRYPVCGGHYQKKKKKRTQLLGMFLIKCNEMKINK